MNVADEFFAILLTTIIVTRSVLFWRPISSPNIQGVRLHHYMYGVILGVTGFLAHNVVLYAIGLGLFVDEFAFLLMKGRDHRDNYSLPSILGTAFFILVIFFLRKYITFS